MKPRLKLACGPSTSSLDRNCDGMRTPALVALLICHAVPRNGLLLERMEIQRFQVAYLGRSCRREESSSGLLQGALDRRRTLDLRKRGARPRHMNPIHPPYWTRDPPKGLHPMNRNAGRVATVRQLEPVILDDEAWDSQLTGNSNLTRPFPSKSGSNAISLS